MNFLKKIFLTILTLSIVTSLSLMITGCPPAVIEETVEETTPEEETEEPVVEEKKYEGVELKIMVHAGSSGERPIYEFAEEFYEKTGAKI